LRGYRWPADAVRSSWTGDDSGPGNTLGYIGRPLSSYSGFYDLRNRQYDPVLRRFLTPDPLGYVDGYDLWQYSGGDPLNYSDPYGLARESGAKNRDNREDEVWAGRRCVANCRDLWNSFTAEEGRNARWGAGDALGDMFTATPVYQGLELAGYNTDAGDNIRRWAGLRDVAKDSPSYILNYWAVTALGVAVEGGG